MKSCDPLLNRVPRPGYKCLDFANEAWLHLTGEQSDVRLNKLVADVLNGRLALSTVKAFTLLKRPKTPCFVLMLREKATPHVGIFIDGRVLHLTTTGAQLQPMKFACDSFDTVKFYE